MKISQNTLIGKLNHAGIKPSLQRLAIFEYVKTHSTHPTVEEVYSSLSPQIPTLSKTTVYNTLHLFKDAGLILELSLDNEHAHFDGQTHLHAHFICNHCGKIYDVCAPDSSWVLPSVLSGDVEKMEISYFGKCKYCINKIK